MLADAGPVRGGGGCGVGGALAVPGGVPVVVADDPATVAVLAGLAGGDLSEAERGGVLLPGIRRM